MLHEADCEPPAMTGHRSEIIAYAEREQTRRISGFGYRYALTGSNPIDTRLLLVERIGSPVAECEHPPPFVAGPPTHIRCLRSSANSYHLPAVASTAFSDGSSYDNGSSIYKHGLNGKHRSSAPPPFPRLHCLHLTPRPMMVESHHHYPGHHLCEGYTLSKGESVL